MRLATRFFLAASALVTVSVVTLTVAAERLLRRQLVSQVEEALGREARLVATQVPADSNQ